MKGSFSPSVNIIRDADKELNYLTTPNAERIVEQFNKYIPKGLRAFYLVGSYGTGKSSFIWALENQIVKGNKIFKTPISFNGKIKYEALNIIGDYISLEQAFKSTLKINGNKNLIESLKYFYQQCEKNGKGLLIVIDEFGKFLEFASKNQPEKELYLIQKIAEFANQPDKNILFITTIHQGIDAYRVNLDSKSRNEWEKVKGRLIEIPFNEPVEQLLYLAAEYIQGTIKETDLKNFRKLHKAILQTRIYPLNNNLTEELAEKLFPFDLITVGFLTKALQRFGQNERSLFTFLNSSDIKKRREFFNLESLYDYLINNFYSVLSSKYNPDFLKWNIIKNSIERVETYFEKESISKEALVKVIGLLNIFSQAGAKINKNFLEFYGKYSLGIKNVPEELAKLIDKKIVRYQSYSESYVLFEGTDIDLDVALAEAENHITQYDSIVPVLKEYFDLPYVLAKNAYLIKGTPRFFEYIISENPVFAIPKGEIDGYINIIFSDNAIDKTLKVSNDRKDATLFVINRSTSKIKETIKEIDKINYVISNTPDDRIVQRELKNLKEYYSVILNHLLIKAIFSQSNVTWIYAGKEIPITSMSDLNKTLSNIVEQVYFETPKYNNELNNREKLPAAIVTAKKNLILRLLNNYTEEDLGFLKDQFPPEKTIYYSLIKRTGIHRKVEDQYILTAPYEDTFKMLWRKSEEFFEAAKVNKKCLLDLIEILQKKPIKLKQGFIDFWIPILLVIKKDDYALYSGEIYIPELDNELFDLIIRYPQNYFIKTFDIDGIKLEVFNKYRELVNRNNQEKFTNKTFVETIKPFLSFYKNLPEYSKKTIRISSAASKLRDAIANSKEPEKTFFEDFPTAIGYNISKLRKSEKGLSNYIFHLQNAIREIRTCYTNLVERMEEFIKSRTSLENSTYPAYCFELEQRYQSIKTHLLTSSQKVFYNRVKVNMDDKSSWINSLIHALIGKPLEKINDEEEEIIYEKLNDLFKEFDNLLEIKKLKTSNNEDVVKVEITSLDTGTKKNVIRLNKNKSDKTNEIKKKIKLTLSEDKNINKRALLELLKEYIDE